jgi:hypothetical protein
MTPAEGDAASLRSWDERTDERFVCLRWWRAGDRVPIADARIRFDDPWLRLPDMAPVHSATSATPDRFHQVLAFDPIRPRQVAELIRAWAGRAEPDRDFELVGGERQLCPRLPWPPWRRRG